MLVHIQPTLNQHWQHNGFVDRIAFPFDVFPLSLHESMFMITLENQLSDEQKKKWLAKAKNYELIGTYAQTELGHGLLE